MFVVRISKLILYNIYGLSLTRYMRAILLLNTCQCIIIIMAMTSKQQLLYLVHHCGIGKQLLQVLEYRVIVDCAENA